MIQREEVCELVLMFLEDIQGNIGNFEQEGARCRSFGCVSRLEKKMRVENEGGWLHVNEREKERKMRENYDDNVSYLLS